MAKVRFHLATIEFEAGVVPTPITDLASAAASATMSVTGAVAREATAIFRVPGSTSSSSQAKNGSSSGSSNGSSSSRRPDARQAKREETPAVEPAAPAPVVERSLVSPQSAAFATAIVQGSLDVAGGVAGIATDQIPTIQRAGVYTAKTIGNAVGAMLQPPPPRD